MSNNAHTAFGTFPTTARGLLCQGNYQPLTIRGCAVNVEAKGYSARVRVTYEYINETNDNQRVIAAYSLPFGWLVQSCEAEYNDDVVRTHYMKSATVVSVDAASAVAVLGGSAGTADRSTAWCDVVSQLIPWTIVVGDAMRLTVTYIVALPAVEMVSRFEMRLPLEQLIPSVSQPAKTTLEYNELFSTAVTRTQYLPTAEVSVRVTAQLSLPVRGEVKVAQLELDGVTQSTVENVQVEHVTDAIFNVETKGHINAFRRRPLIIGCGVQDTEEPLRVFVETDTAGTSVRPEDQHALAIGFTPRLFDMPPNTELVLLVDVHSRENASLVARAAVDGLAALPRSVSLNAVVLHGPMGGSSSSAAVASQREYGTCVFAEGSRPVAQVDLDVFGAALQALVEAAPPRQLESGGDSHLAEALRALLSGVAGPLTAGVTPRGLARNVVVVTDAGETAAKAPTMIQEVVAARDRGRVHVVALVAPSGPEAAKVDVGQLTVLARQAGGLFATATTDEPVSVTRAIVRAAYASTVPTLTDVRVRVEGRGDGAGASLRAAFDLNGPQPMVPHNKTRLLYAIASAETSHVSILVTGRVGTHVIEYNLDVAIASQPTTQNTQQAAPGDTATMGLLHASAAAARVEYLVEEHPHNAAPSSAESREIMALSAIFAIPSPYTQLVQTRQNAAGTAQADQVVLVASRYLPRYCLYPAELKAARTARMTAQSSAPFTSEVRHDHGVDRHARSGAECTSTADYMQGVVNGIVRSATRGEPCAESLLRLQCANDGSYVMSAQLAACVGAPLATLEDAMPESCPSSTAWATAVALHAMHQAEDRLTLLAADRAEAYLQAQCADVHDRQWQRWLAAVARVAGEEESS